MNSSTQRQTESGSPLPLNQFKPGQLLYVRFRVGKTHLGDAAAKFVRIERGLVVVRFIDKGYLKPEWFEWGRGMKRQFPGLQHKTRAVSCYLWMQGEGDAWPRCHWFKDTKTPAK